MELCPLTPTPLPAGEGLTAQFALYVTPDLTGGGN